MQIRLSEIAKRYHRWIFQNVNFTFDQPGAYGIAGNNGSGKSTLLSIIAGFTTPTRGVVNYFDPDHQPIPSDEVYRYLTVAVPYGDIVGELTLAEHLRFHCKFKSLQGSITQEDFFKISNLENHRELPVNHLSSGLLQRFKLSLAFLDSSPIVLVDEPTSYLDAKSKSWFKDLFMNYSADRLVILASNEAADLALTNSRLEVEQFAQ